MIRILIAADKEWVLQYAIRILKVSLKIFGGNSKDEIKPDDDELFVVRMSEASAIAKAEEIATREKTSAIKIGKIIVVTRNIVLYADSSEEEMNLPDLIEIYKIYKNHCNNDKIGLMEDLEDTKMKLSASEKSILTNMRIMLDKSMSIDKASLKSLTNITESIRDMLKRSEAKEKELEISISRTKAIYKTGSKSTIEGYISKARAIEKKGILSDIQFNEKYVSAIAKHIVLVADYSIEKVIIRSEYSKSNAPKGKRYYALGDIKVDLYYSGTNPEASIIRNRLNKTGVDGPRHPHINARSICLGSKGNIRLSELLKKGDVFSALEFICLSLRVYSEVNPYGYPPDLYYPEFKTSEAAKAALMEIA